MKGVSIFIIILFSLGCALAVWAYSRQADNQTRHAQIASCERVNLLREEFNRRGTAIRMYVHEEIVLAERVIESPDSHPIERYTARRNIIALAKLSESFASIPIPNCRFVVAEAQG